jgi:hypothetical protein
MSGCLFRVALDLPRRGTQTLAVLPVPDTDLVAEILRHDGPVARLRVRCAQRGEAARRRAHDREQHR